MPFKKINSLLISTNSIDNNKITKIVFRDNNKIPKRVKIKVFGHLLLETILLRKTLIIFKQENKHLPLSTFSNNKTKIFKMKRSNKHTKNNNRILIYKEAINSNNNNTMNHKIISIFKRMKINNLYLSHKTNNIFRPNKKYKIRLMILLIFTRHHLHKISLVI